MNRKTILFSGIVLILTGILLWNYGIFSRFNYLTAKSDISNNNPYKIQGGEPLISAFEMDKVSEKYGFKNIFTGCIVTETESKGLEIYNSEINKHLSKINGADWELKYQKEIDSLIELKQQERDKKLSFVSQNDYEKNLEIASELYLLKKEISDNILLNLVPNHQEEFSLFYSTTGPEHRLAHTSFFYDISNQIFEKATTERKERFYLPSLKLISFADGEFAEGFIEYLERIIEMDKTKFCLAIKGMDYVRHNPIKAYSEMNKCK